MTTRRIETHMAGAATKPFPATSNATNNAWQRLKTDRYAMGGLMVVLGFFVIALCVWSGLLGQGWSQVSGERWEGASLEHWFGTNLLGQDILQRTLFATATAFEVGLFVTLCTTVLGAVFGALSGWFASVAVVPKIQNSSWCSSITRCCVGINDLK